MSRCALGLGSLLWAAGTLGLSVARGETYDFDRYQVIIQRSPFGMSSAGVSLIEAQQGWASDFAFFGRVTLTNGQVLAVIHRKSANRSYLKAPGESIDEVSVLRIESEGPSPRVALRRGFETAVLEYVPGLAATVTPTPVPGAGQPGTAPAPTITTTTTPSTIRRIPFRRGNQ